MNGIQKVIIVVCVLAILVSILALLYAFAMPLPAQTRIDSATQVSPRPSIVAMEYATCSASGPTWDCKGIGYAKLKFSDGTVKSFTLVPTDAAPDSKWTSVPVTLPPGSTSVPCSQTKP